MCVNKAVLSVERELERQTVLITRAVQPTGDRLTQLLAGAGAKCIQGPVITISPPESWDSLDQALDRIENYRSCVFLSQHGVQAFCRRVEKLGKSDLIDPVKTRLSFFCVGEGTQSEWMRLSGCSSTVPNESNSRAMATLLTEQQQESPFLVVRGNRGSQVLEENLVAAGIRFKQVLSYHSVDVEEADPQLVMQMKDGQFNWVTVTSSAIANSLIRLYGSSLKKTRLASISPITSAVLLESGFQPAVEAKAYNFAGLVNAMSQHASSQSKGDLP